KTSGLMGILLRGLGGASCRKRTQPLLDGISHTVRPSVQAGIDAAIPFAVGYLLPQLQYARSSTMLAPMCASVVSGIARLVSPEINRASPQGFDQLAI